MEKYSLKPVVAVLEKELGKSVTFLEDTVGKEVEEHVSKAKDGKWFARYIRTVLCEDSPKFHAL